MCEDIAATVLAGIRAGDESGIFNVTDDEPAPPQDVVDLCGAELLGIEPPPLVPWEEAERKMTPMARSFYRRRSACGMGGLRRSWGWCWRIRLIGRGWGHLRKG